MANIKNINGKELEDKITEISQAYETMGILTLEKVDPPSIQKGRFSVRLQSPFLDFTGAWTEHHGRAIYIEAKSTTDKKSLAFGEDHGVNQKQRSSLDRWHRSGAATMVIWERCEANQLYAVFPRMMWEQLHSGRKSINFKYAIEIPRGNGWIEWDFLATLRAEYEPNERTR